LPSNVTAELKVIDLVCRCDSSYLDVWHRELEIINFTISNPNNTAYSALRVGRLFLRWDSYRRPCVEIVVEDVDVLVEFVNLILSKTNWNELKEEYDFPPRMLVEESEMPADSFARIGGLYLLGRTKVSVRSRPLKKDVINDVVLEFASLQELMTFVNKKACQERILHQDGKKSVTVKGLTPEEFTALVGGWFKTKVSSMLKEATKFAIGTGAQVDSPELTNALNLAKKVATQAQEAAKSYSLDAVDFAKQNVIGTSAAIKLTKWGLSPREANEVVGSILESLFPSRDNQQASNDV